MSRLYGSLTNRYSENRMFVPEIEKGTYVTEYLWSDRHAYEVVKVVDQKHVFIRRLKAIRTDNWGMSDAQNYRYESDEKASTKELVKRGEYWYEVFTFSKEIHDKIVKEVGWCLWSLTEKQWARIDEGKVVKRYSKLNVSFGVADEYWDYSF